MELAALGNNHKALRDIAKNLISVAMGSGKDAMAAIKEIGDRLDGRPAQEVEVSGEVTSFVARVPQTANTAEAWENKHNPLSLQ
jgi:hypothetical protein